MHSRTCLRFLIALLAAAMVVACGGGEEPAVSTQATSTVTGVATKTASGVTVGGIAFTASGNTVVVADDVRGTMDDVQSGRVIKVRGQHDGRNGRADRIEVENEVRGVVTAVDAAARTFNIGPVKVAVDDRTVFDDLPGGFPAIVVGINVEVHGVRDAAGVLHASRVEAKARNDANPNDELRGRINNLDTTAKTFQLDAVTVNYAAATFRPEGTSANMLANGVLVEVHGAFSAGGTVFTAVRIDFEDLEDQMRPDDARIELTGRPGAVDVANRTLTIFGITVVVNDATDLRTPLSAIVAGVTRVEVRGHAGASGTVVADRVEAVGNSGGSGRDILQAIVTAKDEAAGRITLLGVIADVSRAEFEDFNDAAIPRAQFFAAITIDRTVVKVQGVFNAGTDFVAEEAELED